MYSRTHCLRIVGSTSRRRRRSRMNPQARFVRTSSVSMPIRCRRALGTVAVHFCRVCPETETRRGATGSRNLFRRDGRVLAFGTANAQCGNREVPSACSETTDRPTDNRRIANLDPVAKVVRVRAVVDAVTNWTVQRRAIYVGSRRGPGQPGASRRRRLRRSSTSAARSNSHERRKEHPSRYGKKRHGRHQAGCTHSVHLHKRRQRSTDYIQ